MKEELKVYNLGISERIKLRLVEKSQVLNCTEIDYVKLNDALKIVTEEIKPKQEEYKKYEFSKSVGCKSFDKESNLCVKYHPECDYTASELMVWLKENKYKIIKE